MKVIITYVMLPPDAETHEQRVNAMLADAADDCAVEVNNFAFPCELPKKQGPGVVLVTFLTQTVSKAV